MVLVDEQSNKVMVESSFDDVVKSFSKVHNEIAKKLKKIETVVMNENMQVEFVCSKNGGNKNSAKKMKEEKYVFDAKFKAYLLSNPEIPLSFRTRI